MRHTVILHHSHSTCISAHAGTRGPVRRLMRYDAAILLWVIHHVLRRLLLELLLEPGLLLVVGVVMGLRRNSIGVKRC